MQVPVVYHRRTRHSCGGKEASQRVDDAGVRNALIALPPVNMLMAKGTYIKGNIDLEANLGTLAGTTLQAVPTTDQVSERTRLTSIDCSYSLSDFTPTADVGPVIVGVAHGDYSQAEIEEWVELATGWDVADLVSREISSRLIRRIGVFETVGDANDVFVLNDGKPIKTRLNWPLESGQGLDFWVYNSGSAAFVTTTPDIGIKGHANLFTK